MQVDATNNNTHDDHVDVGGPPLLITQLGEENNKNNNNNNMDASMSSAVLQSDEELVKSWPKSCRQNGAYHKIGRGLSARAVGAVGCRAGGSSSPIHLHWNGRGRRR